MILPVELGLMVPEERLDHERQLREQAIAFYKQRGIPDQQPNGDEEAYKDQNYYANYTKGLPHDDDGQVITEKYQVLLEALRSGLPEDFDRIPLGITDGTHFTNPQGGLAFDTEGIDSHALALPPAPKFNSAEAIGEIAENYWLALARDVPFSQYDMDQTTKDAANDLSQYVDFRGPKERQTQQVTTKTLFRGFTGGDLIGPYLSQFLIRDIPYGAQSVSAKLTFGLPTGEDYLIDPDEWRRVQDGYKPNAPAVDRLNQPRYIATGRDLAQYVHIDVLFQAYLNACLLLLTPKSMGGLDAPKDEGNPYSGYDPLLEAGQTRMSNQDGFGTLGAPNFQAIVAEVATRALKAVWYQKWFVHRRQRPEEYAGRIHFHLDKHLQYDFHPEEFKKLQKTVLPRIKQKNNEKSWLLPQAFPEGCPLHPSYGAGHATVAGACVTMLKALFYEDVTFTSLGGPLLMPNDDGTQTVEYQGADVDQITIGSELNKLATNIAMARDFAGVHWRSDYTESLKLGEKVALYFLQEYVQTYNEHVSFSIRRFDGTRVTVSKLQPF